MSTEGSKQISLDIEGALSVRIRETQDEAAPVAGPPAETAVFPDAETAPFPPPTIGLDPEKKIRDSKVLERLRPTLEACEHTLARGGEGLEQLSDAEAVRWWADREAVSIWLEYARRDVARTGHGYTAEYIYYTALEDILYSGTSEAYRGLPQEELEHLYEAFFNPAELIRHRKSSTNRRRPSDSDRREKAEATRMARILRPRAELAIARHATLEVQRGRLLELERRVSKVA